MKQENLFEIEEVKYENTETKWCYGCETEKPLDDYQALVYASGTIEYKGQCNPCRRRTQRIVYILKKNNPIDHATHKCEICSTTLEEITRGPKYFVLDHCHKTETFRGWVCSSCNTGIGALGDDPEIVKKALNYLEKHNQ